MKLLTQAAIRPPDAGVTEFRISPWGPLVTALLFLTGLFVGLALFVYSYQSSSILGMTLSGLYALIMWGICVVVFRALTAVRSPANWLARIGPDGILLKYRSYLHGDSPAEDPVAVDLPWRDIADAQLRRERYITTQMDEKSESYRWYLAVRLAPRHVDIARVKSALEFEHRRRPAHFKVDDLKHELFLARKNKAPAAEIARLKAEIVAEKRRHPGSHPKSRFHHRPVVFIDPDRLSVEWTHITPGRKKLRQLLAHHTAVMGDEQLSLDIDSPMTETEFESRLATLLGRDDTIEAVKLVRLYLGLDTTQARAYIEGRRQQN